MLQLLGDFVPQTPYRGIALDPTGDPALKACVYCVAVGPQQRLVVRFVN